MHKIQELFDPSKQLNRKIESVVTFGANTTEDLDHEIREYVVTANCTRTMRTCFSIYSRLLIIQVRRSVSGSQASMVLVRVLLPNIWACRLIRA